MKSISKSTSSFPCGQVQCPKPKDLVNFDDVLPNHESSFFFRLDSSTSKLVYAEFVPQSRRKKHKKSSVLTSSGITNSPHHSFMFIRPPGLVVIKCCWIACVFSPNTEPFAVRPFVSSRAWTNSFPALYSSHDKCFGRPLFIKSPLQFRRLSEFKRGWLPTGTSSGIMISL